MLKYIALIMVLMISSACTRENPPAATIDPVSKTASVPILDIDGKILTEEDFFDFANTVLREMDPESFGNEEVKQKLLKDFTEHNLLLMEAERRGVKVDDERIKTVLNSFRTESGSQDLKVYSGSFETDHNKLAKLMQERLIAESLLNDIINVRIVITEKDIKDYYNKNQGLAKPQAKAHILHIFTTDLEVARKAMAELKKGLSFNEVAERYSEGPEKSSGGDLGFVADSDFPEIFSEAFKLPAGKISDIVKSDYGYHIFYVKRFEKPKKISYESVKSKIQFELYSEQQEEKTRGFIDELYEKSIIKVINDVDLAHFGGKRSSGSVE